MTNISYEILNSITESMAVLNRSGEIIFINNAWREFSENNMGDDTCTGLNNNYLTTCERVEGDDKELATKAKIGIQQVIDKKRKIFELEYPCHSNTEERWFILRVSSVTLNPELTLVSHINITNRKIAELEVERNYRESLYINNRLESTLYKVVHDIQNPLFGITCFIEFSKSESDIKKIKQNLEKIHEASVDFSLFIENTLNQISSSNKLEVINANQLISEYLKSIEGLLKSRSIEVSIDIKQSSQIISNAVEFRSIISNLIGNSVKYIDKTKTKNSIEITISSNKKLTILKIRDNGIGIKDEDLPKIMNYNYQGNKKESEGVGLGLFMVQGSVAMLGGTITVNSDFGIGTEFIVKLPNSA